jgi:hypothetical protein
MKILSHENQAEIYPDTPKYVSIELRWRQRDYLGVSPSDAPDATIFTQNYHIFFNLSCSTLHSLAVRNNILRNFRK